MLTTGARRHRPARLDDGGFTLVELLVAMSAAIVVIFGATTILIVSMHQTQRTFSEIDATRQARTALANIENELHSACVGGQSPIAGVADDGTVESDANNLVFLSYTGGAATPTPVWHQLTFSSSSDTLTDTTYAASPSGSGWTVGASQSTTTMLTNVAQRTNSSGAVMPVFQYYAYTPEYTDSAGNVYWTIPDGTDVVPGSGATPNAPLSTSAGLAASDAANVVEVVINLLVGPSTTNPGTSSQPGIDDAVSDAISLRLTTPPNMVAAATAVPAGQVPQGYGPCQ